MPPAPSAHRWYDAVLVVALVVVAMFGLVGIASHPAPVTTVTIGTITTLLVPAGNSTPAPNGTGPIGGDCTNSSYWFDNETPGGALGPPFAPNSTAGCLFAFPYTSYYHPPTNDSRAYLIGVGRVNVSAPFIYLRPDYQVGGPPPNQTSPEYTGAVFRFPSQPGTYDITFTVYYTWQYT